MLGQWTDYLYSEVRLLSLMDIGFTSFKGFGGFECIGFAQYLNPWILVRIRKEDSVMDYTFNLYQHCFKLMVERQMNLFLMICTFCYVVGLVAVQFYTVSFNFSTPESQGTLFLFCSFSLLLCRLSRYQVEICLLDLIQVHAAVYTQATSMSKLQKRFCRRFSNVQVLLKVAS